MLWSTVAPHAPRAYSAANRLTMLNTLRSLFQQRQAPPPPSVPEGERYYVLGDIHGRADLLDAMKDAIEADDASAGAATSTVVLLGDLVDRGPDSAGVINRVVEWQARRTVRCLAGNHEEMFLGAFDDPAVLRQFVKHGGRETILSYGINKARYASLTMEELFAELPELVPAEHRAFLQGLEDVIVAGDYAFVHAGIDPNLPLEEQAGSALRWIRQPFLEHGAPHSHMIVHGHTITEDVEERPNRIGIDTGAYRTGRLTALILEGATRRYLRTADTDGAVTVEQVETQ